MGRIFYVCPEPDTNLTPLTMFKWLRPSFPRIPIERMFAIVATTDSVCALVLSFCQANLARKQQYASVWPYLMISTTNVPLDRKTPQFSIELDNKGVGPATTETYDIAHKGHHFSDEKGYVAYLRKEGQLTNNTTSYFQRSALWKGRVISAGEQSHWFVLQGPLARFVESAFGETKITIRFKSIYGETWEYRSDTEEMVVKVEE